MLYHRLSRRHLLQGAGAALALPFLPSLMSSAEAATLPEQKFLVMMAHGHGGVAPESLYPIASTVSANLTTQQLYAAQNGAPKHDLRFGRLVDLKRTHAQTAAARLQPMTDFDNGSARVSPLVGSFVPDSILAKMNLIAGLDVMSGSGHWSGMFGNFANTFGGPPDTTDGRSATQVPTIDYAIQKSNKFYAAEERSLLRAPSLLLGSDRRGGGGGDLSTYQSGADVGQNPYFAWRVGEVFSRLFTGVSSMPGQMGDPDAPLVDRLYEDYRRLARSPFGAGRRLGKDDRVRLEAYMQNLQELGSRLKAVTAAACVVPTMMSSNANRIIRTGDVPWEWDNVGTGQAERMVDVKQVSELINTMIVQSFLCGTSRIVLRQVAPTCVPDAAYIADYHHLVYHNHFKANIQQDYMSGLRPSFEYAFVDLAKRLDAASVANGVSLLDRTLMYWTAESGIGTHDSVGFPTITAGGAGGAIKTGNYLDLRNLSVGNQYGYSEGITPAEREVVRYYRGVPQNRWLATICQAMGLAPADYELPDATFSTKFPSRGGKAPGYGDPAAKGYFYTYPKHLVDDMSLPLPIVS